MEVVMFLSWLGKKKEVIVGAEDILIGSLMKTVLSIAEMHLHSKIEWTLERRKFKSKKVAVLSTVNLT